MKNRMLRLVSVLVALVFLVAVGVCAAGFEKTNTYTEGTFKDVPQTEWYAKEVQGAYELGLMNGKGEGMFVPQGNVTVAEAITMASRAAAAYAGEEIPAADGEWYQMYVNYATSKGFVKEGQFDSFTRLAKRYEVAVLFENAMPEGYYTAKNDVAEIPDVDATLPYEADLMNLYKAGVVMGSDSYGNFRPEDNITRAEAAAIINRVALDNRLAKTLDKYSKDDAYVLVYNEQYSGNKEGINSGWRLDNRGGVPRQEMGASLGSLTDISKTDGTAMIREFNKVTTGKFNLSTAVTVTGTFDGFSLEFNNEAGKPVYQAITKDGGWSLLQADGSYVTLLADAGATKKFVFDVEVDLDNARCTTYINKALCGTYPLAATGQDLNMVDFRFATSEAGTPNATFQTISIKANYAFNDIFSWHVDGQMPLGWSGTGAINEKSMLKVSENGFALRSFSPVSGTVMANVEFILDKSQSIGFDVKSGAKSIVKFTSDADNFYANGVKVYENYVENLWYRVRVEAHTYENKAIIYVNSRKVGEVDFAEKATSVDNVVITNTSAEPVSFDDINVFEKVYHEDYVPVPVKPAGEEKYTVGMNICSLWQNGMHWGWSTITPYDDIIPVLGYYDEGVVETADWEIKYFVEHGVDFQAFCWYPENSKGNTPIKAPRYSTHLYDAYMFAEYSDMMKYCLIWECANAGKPTNMNDWKSYFVPYFIENFFKDDRYLVLDNQPVLAVFGSNNLSEAMGGAANLKAAFDYLDEEVKKLGFDGMIYLSSHNSSASIADMGFDGFVAYNWGNAGYTVDTNKNSILKAAKSDRFYTVPTVSVGFNNVAWAGTRFPLMTKNDFNTVNSWVRDEYLPSYQTEGSWNENLVWLSTWNEYGEGTYMMPTRDEKGFGYLDVLREVYSDEKTDASINTVPTEAQLYRINHLFPQYRRLLRKQVVYKDEATADSLKVVAVADYSKKDKIAVGNTKTFEFKADGLHGTVEGDTLTHVNDLAINASEVTHVKITIEVPKGKGCEIFFITNNDKSWSASKGTSFTASKDGLAEYLVDMSKVSTWKDTVTCFRLDPGQCAPGTTGNDFHIKSIEFLAPSKAAAKVININDLETKMTFSYSRAANGDMLVAFDPAINLDFKLGAFHTWTAGEKTLKIEVNGHEVVYTVGASDYIVDGKTKALGYELTAVDGLPLIPINSFCEAVGFEFSENEDGEAVIYTHQKDYYADVASREPGVWNFNSPGDSESWVSSHMQLLVEDGYLSATSISDHRDPIITLGAPFINVDLVADKYKAFEIRCRFKCDRESNGLTMYFITDSDSAWKEGMTIKSTLKAEDNGGDWVTYTVDLKDNPGWVGIIKSFRFDPFNAVGTMDIDYMKFIEDENYVEPEPVVEVFGIKNGAADQGVQPFHSNNADISVIKEDGENIFLVKSKSGKQWTYFRQNLEFTPGKTYQIEFDVKLVGKGEVTDGSEAADKTQIIPNMRYAGSDGKIDHILTGGADISVSDGWKHRSYTFTVDAGSVDRSFDQFAIYANPIGDYGANFCVDNVVITEVEG